MKWFLVSVLIEESSFEKNEKSDESSAGDEKKGHSHST